MEILPKYEKHKKKMNLFLHAQQKRGIIVSIIFKIFYIIL